MEGGRRQPRAARATWRLKALLTTDCAREAAGFAAARCCLLQGAPTHTSTWVAAKQLTSCGAPGARRGERSVRDQPRSRAHARCSAAWSQGSAQGLSSGSSCSSSGDCGPWHCRAGWVTRAGRAVRSSGWVCWAGMPSARARGALWSPART